MTEVDKLRATVARLRGPDGCPWDREQTHRSLTRCLVEETSELLDTIDREDFPHMREELGDVLLQVVFHSQMAEECGRFDLEAVVREINDKLIRRHPHVFGEDSFETSEEVLVKWEEIKAAEKSANGKATSTGPFKTLPPQLPALLYARDVIRQMDKASLDPGNHLPATRIQSLATDLDEVSAGQQLLTLVAACTRSGIDPEAALRRAASALVQSLQADSPPEETP